MRRSPHSFSRITSAGYNDIRKVKVGAYCLDDIYHTLSKYTPEDAMVQSDQRERVLRCSAPMLSGTQRFREVQRIVETHLASEDREDIGPLLIMIHDWRILSRYSLCHANGELFLHKIQEKYKSFQLFNCRTNRHEVWGLVGRKGAILIMKYGEDFVLPLIVRRQREEAAK